MGAGGCTYTGDPSCMRSRLSSTTVGTSNVTVLAGDSARVAIRLTGLIAESIAAATEVITVGVLSGATLIGLARLTAFEPTATLLLSEVGDIITQPITAVASAAGQTLDVCAVQYVPREYQ